MLSFMKTLLATMWEQSFPQLPTMQCQEGERPQAVPREILHREQAEGLSRLGMVGGRNAILVPKVLGADITKGTSKRHRAPPLESPLRCSEGTEVSGCEKTGHGLIEVLLKRSHRSI